MPDDNWKIEATAKRTDHTPTKPIGYSIFKINYKNSKIPTERNAFISS